MRMKVTQREIKEWVRCGLAIDITHYDFNKCREIQEGRYFNVLCISRGVYGVNGAILEDDEHTRYAITARTTALFMFI